MKLLTTLLIAALAALAVYSARRRIWFALKVGFFTYVIVLAVRLVLSAGSFADRWDDLVWPVLLMLALWAVLWVASTMYTQRKAAQRKGR
jgi:hypothetical protein